MQGVNPRYRDKVQLMLLKKLLPGAGLAASSVSHGASCASWLTHDLTLLSLSQEQQVTALAQLCYLGFSGSPTKQWRFCSSYPDVLASKEHLLPSSDALSIIRLANNVWSVSRSGVGIFLQPYHLSFRFFHHLALNQPTSCI